MWVNYFSPRWNCWTIQLGRNGSRVVFAAMADALGDPFSRSLQLYNYE